MTQKIITAVIVERILNFHHMQICLVRLRLACSNREATATGAVAVSNPITIASRFIDEDAFGRIDTSPEISSGIYERNVEYRAIIAKLATELLADIEISADVLQPGSMKPVGRRPRVVRNCQSFVLDGNIRIAEEAGPYRLIGLPNESSDRLRAKVHPFDQIVPSIENGMIENGFDDRPHLVCGAKVVGSGEHAKRGRTEMKAHLQSVQGEPRNAVANAHTLSQNRLAASATTSNNVEHQCFLARPIQCPLSGSRFVGCNGRKWGVSRR